MDNLNITVSCFNNVYSSKPSCMVNLLEWVTTDIYKKEIEKLRKIKNKAQRDYEKRKLPAIAPSGVFKEVRKAGLLAQHSGIISLDIDRKENKHLTTDLEKLKARVSQISEVAFCGLSASGTGLYVLIPIEQTEVHRLYFEMLKEYFYKSLGIIVDKGCSDVSRLRIISYDSSYYLNNDAKVLGKVCKSVIEPTKRHVQFDANVGNPSDQLYTILEPVFASEIDITQTRDDWFKVCSVIVNVCGEKGRQLFHYVSLFYPKYSSRECDALYDDLLKREPYKYGLGTLVYIVNKYI